MFDRLFQYILGYCTWWGLAAIGEPHLTTSLPPDCRIQGGFPPQARNELKEPMPAWIILIFCALVAGRYISSFLVSFFFRFFFLCSQQPHIEFCFREREKNIYIYVYIYR